MDKSLGSNLGSAKEEQGSEDLKQSTADMTLFVQNLLVQMSINHLKAEMGVDGAAKATPEETKPSEGTD
ncbi:hypothetical protein DsansV1_C13g0119341 [Dioscorea sansibarensis]